MRASEACAALILLALVPGAAAQPALPTEHVIVTAPKNVPDAMVDHFVQSFTAKSYLTGKVARWERGICPVTLGLAPKFTAFITARVRAVAARAGAPVDKDLSCRANIEIVFTTTPQAMADELRKNHKIYLGYAEGPGRSDRLAVVRHPIQAWYLTATKDLAGHEEVDSFYNMPVEPVANLIADLGMGGADMPASEKSPAAASRTACARYCTMSSSLPTPPSSATMRWAPWPTTSPCWRWLS